MVDSRFKVEQLNEQPKQNPNLIPKKNMEAYARTANKSSKATYHEIFKRINNA